jgi:hypothetical protein
VVSGKRRRGRRKIEKKSCAIGEEEEKENS